MTPDQIKLARKLLAGRFDSVTQQMLRDGMALLGWRYLAGGGITYTTFRRLGDVTGPHRRLE